MEKTKEEIVLENLKNIEEWALQGMSEKEIAECLNVGYSTFRQIKAKEIALIALFKHCAKIKRESAKNQVEIVERSLFERAKGYNVQESVPIKLKKTHINPTSQKEYTDEEVEVVTVTKYIPADVQAARFFLLNRAKRMWQDNPHKVENDKGNLELKKKQIERGEW